MLLHSSPLLLLSFRGASLPSEYQNVLDNISCLPRLDLGTSSTDYEKVIQLSMSLGVRFSTAFIKIPPELPCQIPKETVQDSMSVAAKFEIRKQTTIVNERSLDARCSQLHLPASSSAFQTTKTLR